jgi:sec-independent protein translocase protein TatA
VEFGFGKLLLLLAMVMLVFGTAKLPRIGEDLGKPIRSFKQAAREGGEG